MLTAPEVDTVYFMAARATKMNRLQQVIRELMDAQGMTASALAKDTGIPRQTLYNLLSPSLAERNRAPRPGTLHKLAKALKVQPALLLDAMNETKGYDVEVVDSADPTSVAIMTVLEMMDDDQRHTMLAVAKSLLRDTK